jgi:DNA-binding GntR family transcriptional regulator
MKPDRSIEHVIRPKSVSEVVLERLRSDIVTNRFALGEKISEGQLSEIYNVTKAPIRSAYIRLEAEGILEIRAQSGTYVFKPTAEELRALCELRTALELEALSLAMERNATKLQTEVAGILEAMEKQARAARVDEYQKLDTDLHKLFFENARSPFLLETYLSKVNSRFAALRTRFSQERKHIEHSLAEHRALAGVIEAGDVEHARSLLRAHIGYSEVYYTRFADTP